VSDVALLGGLQPGFSKWGNINVEICPDGHLGLPGTDLLAGAGHLLDWDIRVFMESTGANLAESIRTVTLNPARILGLDFEEKGFCEGAPADLVEFYLGNERLVVSQYCLGSFCSEV
jgi:N-acetylglucosamine-6-phosphate deacetylase